MAYPHFPNTQMVVKVNPTLKIWWKDIKGNRGLEAKELLGGLTALISVESDRNLIKALLKFWDSERLVFKFRDFELTLTIEEICWFLYLPYKEREMIVPRKPTPRKFACSPVKWERYRLNAFAVALLGSLVFPREGGKIHISLSYMVRMMSPGGKTIVPMILA
ncbi:hypothetical protein KY289_016361 [Solanum tuberosum]|nr:hypothetical protein KY289_016361 [Solanum tuberosum]